MTDLTGQQQMPPLRRHDSFARPLSEFQRRLTDEDRLSFRDASARDVHMEILRLQQQHEVEKSMQNFVRLAPFLDAMSQLEKVVTQSGMQADALAFIWGPMKRIFKIAGDKSDLLDILLDAYEKIGSNMPLLDQYVAILEDNLPMLRVVGLIYADLLEFHEQALNLYSGRGRWRQIFRSLWNDFRPLLEHLLGRLALHESALTEQSTLQQTVQGPNSAQLILFHINQYEIDRMQAKEKFVREENSRRNQDLVLVLEWLAPASTTVAEHEHLCSERQKYPGSGNWLLSNEKIDNWIDGDPPISSALWMYGIPGAGKTILASKLIVHCQQFEAATTAFFYCKEGDDERSDCLSIYKGLLAQLVTQQPALVPYFLEKRCSSGTVVLTSQLLAEQLLTTMLEVDTRFYIIVDGLDECEPAQIKLFMAYISKLVAECDEHEPGKLRFMFISQNIRDVRDALPKNAATILEITHQDNEQDIENFVRYWVEKLQRDHNLGIQQVKELTINTCGRARGMFLFAKLVMSNLNDCETYQELVEEITTVNFPTGLQQAYDRILRRLKRNLADVQWEHVKRLLGWIICAKRSLKWQEIQAVLSIEHENECFNFKEKRLRSDVEQLCGSLVRVLPTQRPEDNRVELVHSTAKSHIIDSPYVHKAVIESELATLCLRYLVWEGFQEIPEEVSKQKVTSVDLNNPTTQRLKSLILREHFLLQDYVVSKWFLHVKAVIGIDPIDLAQTDKGQTALDNLSAAMVDFLDDYDTDIEDNVSSSEDRTACQKYTGHELYEDILRVWTHIREHSEKGLAARNEPSLKRLLRTLARNRDVMEFIATNGLKKGIFDQDALVMANIYGRTLYKCSKLTCFYFYTGFSDKSERDRHVKRHDRPWECTFPDCAMQDCGFMSNKDLERHKKFFHPEAEDLTETFMSHKKPPEGAKFPCTQCDKKFTRMLNLKAHQRAHAGERPYACADCGKAFTRANDCRRHEKGHARRG